MTGSLQSLEFGVRQSMATQAIRDIFVEANGLRHHLIARGAPGSPVVMMVHGLAGQAHVFDAIANRVVGMKQGHAGGGCRRGLLGVSARRKCGCRRQRQREKQAAREARSVRRKKRHRPHYR